MRILLTVVLVILWIPVAFFLTGIGDGLITGHSAEPSPMLRLIAVSVWIAGAILIVWLRRPHRALV